ncbi:MULTISPECIES: acyl carrier protein [Actinomadura]|uniref:Phosphopantetheine attachment site n=1 Tax=Actinomadura madurae TaxID=1993 RepID=A0A1I5IES9_9ACTN|nr:acyl carrier protein [Actinomadura madurae]SFO58974.1 Phosphopantetheine attachment site [Actinomadura madurae]SPT57297.1 Plipastatin synthase subunit D [Actinomadura madurae]
MTHDERQLVTALTDSIREQVGRTIPVDASFFEAGLDSAAMIGVSARLRRRIGREPPISAFFEHPTVRALAVFIAGSAEPADRGAGRPPAGAAWTPYDRRALRNRLRQRKGS